DQMHNALSRYEADIELLKTIATLEGFHNKKNEFQSLITSHPPETLFQEAQQLEFDKAVMIRFLEKLISRMGEALERYQQLKAIPEKSKLDILSNNLHQWEADLKLLQSITTFDEFQNKKNNFFHIRLLSNTFL